MVCHQPNAWGSTDGAIPSLAGQQERYLERQLAVFRSGARVDTAMQIVTAHPSVGSQDDIIALARYLTALEPNPHPVKGSGKHLRVGQELYTHICAACHGVAGQGEAANRVPRIAGQQYPYLKRQIEAAAALHKDLAPPEMTSALAQPCALRKWMQWPITSRVSATPNPAGFQRPGWSGEVSAAPARPRSILISAAARNERRIELESACIGHSGSRRRDYDAQA